MRSNIHEGVVQIIRDEKSNAMMASLRDNRKDKDVDIKRVKTKYKSFLVNYKKDNIARKNHKGWLENIAEPRPTRRSRQLPLEDFDRI